nr:hypothetical protein [Clostridium botulinum]
MNVFFHHVGQEGAKEDFKKTVYTKIDAEFIEENLPYDYMHKTELIEILNSRFLRVNSIVGVFLLVPKLLSKI